MKTTVTVNGVDLVLAHIQSVGEVYYGLAGWSYTITMSTGKAYVVRQEPEWFLNTNYEKYSHAPALAAAAQSEEDREKIEDHRTALLNDLYRLYTK